MPNETAEATYPVVVNHEEQCSTPAADGELPAGWRDAGHAESRDACLAHVDAVWTGVRPPSLRSTERAGR